MFCNSKGIVYLTNKFKNMLLQVGQEINYKGIDLIYSGFQMENKLCFFIKNDNKSIFYLSITQVKKILFT